MHTRQLKPLTGELRYGVAMATRTVPRQTSFTLLRPQHTCQQIITGSLQWDASELFLTGLYATLSKRRGSGAQGGSKRGFPGLLLSHASPATAKKPLANDTAAAPDSVYLQRASDLHGSQLQRCTTPKCTL